MGFTDRVKKIFSGDPKEKTLSQTLEDKGITILADTKLKQKLSALQELYDEIQEDIEETEDPLEYLEELHTRLKKVNRAIHSLAAPNYRAGTNANFREMMEGWVLWNSVAEYWIQAVKDRIKGLVEEPDGKDGNSLQAEVEKTLQRLSKVTAIDVWTLVRRMHTVLQMHVFQDGQLVLAESYLSPDVAPAHATIVKTLPSRGGIDLSDLKEHTEEA